MRRFFAPPELLTGDLIELPADILQHLKVLRLSAGAEIELLDGAGLLLRCRLELLEKQRGLARVKERRQLPEQPLRLQLLQGIPKGSKLELVLQKGTELGITRFSPVYCRFGDVHPAARRRNDKRERWQRIVREASRQCRRDRLPQIDEPVPLAGALAACDAELRIFPWERATRPLQEVFQLPSATSLAMLIGPEGGISAEEADQAVAAGFIPVSLGPRILRSETAGIAVAAVIQYLFGDLGSEGPNPACQRLAEKEGL